MSPSRIDELRRRVENDPASIAFAQLAEEYRRSGQTDEAVRVCREGLTRHPGYLSARVTLGRALLDLGQLGEARGEFEFVVAEAPENLAAVRGLAEICHRDGQIDEALTYYRRALALARHDPEIEEIVQQLSRQVGAAAADPAGSLSFEEAHQELLTAAERVPLATPASSARPTANEGSTAPFDFDRLVAALGSPTAPPQVEAAVEGRAVPVLELAEIVDLGPNPFAALEAELRAHDSVAPPVAPAAEMPADDELTGLADALLASTGPDATGSLAENLAALPSSQEVGDATFDGVAVPAPALEPLAAAGLAEFLAEGAVELPPVLESAVVVSASPVAPTTADTGLTEAPSGLAAADVSMSDAPAAAAAGADESARGEGAKDDVLGDLEDWLSTISDRPAE